MIYGTALMQTVIDMYCQIRGLMQIIGEGNGNPLQYSCLENPMARGGLWAAVPGVTRARHDLATKPPLPLPHSKQQITFT